MSVPTPPHENENENENENISIRNVVDSMIIVGDGNVGLMVKLGGSSGYSDRVTSEPLSPRPLAAINPRSDRQRLIGRGHLVEQATAALLAGRSVQLCGSSGVGKSAVAEAVASRLAGLGQPGLVLAGGRPYEDLASLYMELIRVFFAVSWYTPDETVLRAETARHRPSGVIVIPDFGLDAEDSDRLLGTFPDCRFLLCSRQQSLYGGSEVIDVHPLDLSQAIELVSAQLDRPLGGFESRQVQYIHERCEGRTAQLLVCAAFLRRAAEDARPHDTVPLSKQLSVLIAGLADPDRRVLAVLRDFGPAPAELFGPLTGVESAGSGAWGLEHAGLVSERGGDYALTADAHDALTDHGWKADPGIAADGLQPLLARSRMRGAAGPRVPPALCVAVARALLAANAWERASGFARVAAPAALATGDVTAWRALVAVGVRAAVKGRGLGWSNADLEYFLTEEHTEALLRGDRVAAAAALTALITELAHLSPTAAPNAARGLRALHRTLKARHGALAVAVTAGAGLALAGVVGSCAIGAAVFTRSVVHRDSTTDAAAGSVASTAAAFPYTVTDRPYSTAQAGNAPYTFQADYPVINGLPNNSVETAINLAFSAPLDQDEKQFSAHNATVPDGSTDPGFYSLTTSVYQVGSLISAEYAGSYHAVGQGDIGYTIQAVTVRTDTGAVLQSTDILAPTAMTTDFPQLVVEIQSLPLVGFCTQDYPQSEANLEKALHSGDQGFVVNVTNNGLLFTIQDEQVAPVGCKPTGVLPWSQLNGLVNPQIEQLAGISQSTSGPSTAPTPSVVASPTNPIATNTPVTRVTPITPVAPDTPDTPFDVVQAYYEAINSQDYKKAWSLGGSTLSPTYKSFVNGYSQVEYDDVDIESVIGDTVSVSVTAQLTNGKVDYYSGSYTISDNKIASGHLELIGIT